MQKIPAQYSDRELNRLYVRWILGKNRQRESLTHEELLALVQAGKVKKYQLTPIQVEYIEDKPEEETVSPISETKQNLGLQDYATLLKDEIDNNQQLLEDFQGSVERVADIISEGLLINSQLDYAHLVGDKVWNNLDEPTRKKLGFALFINTYNISPRTFRDELIRRINSS